MSGLNRNSNDQHETETNAQRPESFFCHQIGGLIILLSIASTIIFIIAFGKVPTMYGYDDWSFFNIVVGVAMGLNGCFFGYLLQKIGSVLKYHENKQGWF